MQRTVFLPQVELTMESVRVVAWLVKPGDRVAADQVILEVESQKGVVEVPSTESGILRKRLVEAGADVGERAPLCIITDSADEEIRDEGESTLSIPVHALAPVAAVAAQSANDDTAIRAAPAARKRAKDLNIDLSKIRGSGPEGRITLEDVNAYSAVPKTLAHTTSAQHGTPVPPQRLALIRQMEQSLREIPQFHVSRAMEVAPLLIKQEGISFTHRLIAACASALTAHPLLLTTLHDGMLFKHPLSVAVAIDSPAGLFAPAIRNADQLRLQEIADTLKDFQSRAQQGRLLAAELRDAPFAISNLGMLGVDAFTPFVFAGQTAVLGVGKAINGRSQMTLAVDHRVIDGAAAAGFLETLQQKIHAS